MEEKITYTEAMTMYQEDIDEANEALDYYIELLNKEGKKRRKGG